MKYRRSRSWAYSHASPPSRGAWIEMAQPVRYRAQALHVAPLAGAWIEMFCRGRIRLRLWGRPPRGGRGLKYTIPPKNTAHIRVAPLAGGVD